MVERVAAALLLTCLALGGCASQSKLAEAQLTEFAQWLPGIYDNALQNAEDARAGREQHVGLVLAIVPIYAPRLGDHAYYLQEMAAEDARRITAQRIIAFESAKDGAIIQTSYTFTDPRRWRDGYQNPDLFTSMVLDDVTRVAGCEMRWSREGARFIGNNDPRLCRVSSRGSAELVQLNSRAELAVDEFATADQAYDSSGRLVQGRAGDPF